MINLPNFWYKEMLIETFKLNIALPTSIKHIFYNQRLVGYMLPINVIKRKITLSLLYKRQNCLTVNFE